MIRDTGVGIARGELDAIFQSFVRGETGRRGVGLTIVRRLSDRFGWPVTIDSSPGRGTRVTITSPTHAANRSPSETRFFTRR